MGAEKRVRIELSLENIKDILMQELLLIPYEDSVELEYTEKGITIKYLKNERFNFEISSSFIPSKLNFCSLFSNLFTIFESRNLYFVSFSFIRGNNKNNREMSYIIKRNSQYYAKQANQTVLVLEQTEAFKFQDRQVAQAKANSLKIFYGGQPFEVIKIG